MQVRANSLLQYAAKRWITMSGRNSGSYSLYSTSKISRSQDESKTSEAVRTPVARNKSFAHSIAAKFQMQVETANSQEKSTANSSTEEDSEIQPEWLAMERRVLSRKPKKKGIC